MISVWFASYRSFTSTNVIVVFFRVISVFLLLFWIQLWWIQSTCNTRRFFLVDLFEISVYPSVFGSTGFNLSPPTWNQFVTIFFFCDCTCICLSRPGIISHGHLSFKTWNLSPTIRNVRSTSVEDRRIEETIGYPQ